MGRETADEIKRLFDVVADGLRCEIRNVTEGLKAFHEEFKRNLSSLRHNRPLTGC